MTNTILFYIISGIVVLVLLWILMIEIRLKRIFAGTKARSLEEMIVVVGKKINKIEDGGLFKNI